MPFSVRYPSDIDARHAHHAHHGRRALGGHSASSPRADAGADSAGGLGRHPLSHRQSRRDRHLLSRGGRDGCAGGPAAARLSDLVTHVSQPDSGARSSLPGDRARLSGVRSERHAGPRRVHVQLRALRRADRRSVASARCRALCAVRAGLRRTRRLPSGAHASRARHGTRRPERQCVRRGTEQFWNPIKAYWATVPTRIAQHCVRG